MSSNLKLYTVTISSEIVVLAESKEEAEDIAADIRCRHLTLEPAAAPMRHMPCEWGENTLPFKHDSTPSRTLGEWIALGAAPEYTALREASACKREKDLKP